MKFLALLRKELREALPWMLLAAAIMLGIGGLMVNTITTSFSTPRRYYNVPIAGELLEYYRLTPHWPLSDLGGLVLLTAMGLGLVLALRQFLLPSIFRTWAFSLHRSVSRTTILLAKLVAAGLALALCAGATWSWLFYRITQSQSLAIVPPSRIFWEGWAYVLLGLLVYLGASATALSTARWYTTKIFPVGFATLIGFLSLTQWGLGLCVLTLLVGLAILGPQLLYTFLHREY